jgi:hypothetical protein
MHDWLKNCRLANQYPPKGYDPRTKNEQEAYKLNRRPDLVFLLSNKGLQRIVIVELKAPNTPLHIDHLQQLKGYIRRTEKWLKAQGGDKARFKVNGYLIGSKASPDTKAEKVEALEYEIDQDMDTAAWFVFDIGDVLDQTEAAHRDLLALYERSTDAPKSGNTENE